MLKNLFKKKTENTELVAPITGKVIALEEVPDQVFSQKMMGDGVAIEPSSNEVVSPIDGEIVDVFKTKHAISLKANNGAEILVHMGLETVELDGEGFEVKVSNGDKVEKGDPIAVFHTDIIAGKNYQTITPIILLNSDEYRADQKITDENAKAGETILFELKKN